MVHRAIRLNTKSLSPTCSANWFKIEIQACLISFCLGPSPIRTDSLGLGSDKAKFPPPTYFLLFSFFAWSLLTYSLSSIIDHDAGDGQ